MSSRTVWISLAYINPTVIAASLWDYLASCPEGIADEHIIVDNHYPLDYGGVRLRMEQAQKILPSLTILDPGKNLGLHEGFNYALERVLPGLDDDDLIIAYDLDESPRSTGWLNAMRLVMAADSACGWLSMSSSAIKTALADAPVRAIVGPARARGETSPTSASGPTHECVAVIVPDRPCINHVCSWRVRALRAVGKLEESRPYYGYLEMVMWPKFKAAGYYQGWLRDFYDQHDAYGPYQDAEYQAYKRAHVASSPNTFLGSFEEWLSRPAQSAR